MFYVFYEPWICNPIYIYIYSKLFDQGAILSKQKQETNFYLTKVLLHLSRLIKALFYG